MLWKDEDILGQAKVGLYGLRKGHAGLEDWWSWRAACTYGGKRETMIACFGGFEGFCFHIPTTPIGCAKCMHKQPKTAAHYPRKFLLGSSFIKDSLNGRAQTGDLSQEYAVFPLPSSLQHTLFPTHMPTGLLFHILSMFDLDCRLTH